MHLNEQIIDHVYFSSFKKSTNLSLKLYFYDCLLLSMAELLIYERILSDDVNNNKIYGKYSSF